MPRLKPEIKSKWVSALRSGKYPQTTGALHRVKAFGTRSVGYCCLGVLLTIEGIPVKKKLDSEGRAIFYFLEPGWISAGSPPDYWFRSLFEVCSADEAEYLRRKFISMNDPQRRSFPEIADWIEENL